MAFFGSSLCRVRVELRSIQNHHLRPPDVLPVAAILVTVCDLLGFLKVNVPANKVGKVERAGDVGDDLAGMTSDRRESFFYLAVYGAGDLWRGGHGFSFRAACHTFQSFCSSGMEYGGWLVSK